jgi:hypothetical protein
MKYGSEMEIFRKALKFLSSFKLQNDRTTSDAVLVIYIFLNIYSWTKELQ